jgi:ATP-dependent Zn protease
MTPKQPLPVDYASPGMLPPKRFARGLVGWGLFIGLAIMFVLLMRRTPSASASPASFDQFYSDIESGNVQNVTISDDDVIYLARPLPGYSMALVSRVKLPQGMGHDWNFIHWIADSHNHNPGPKVSFETSNNLVVNLLLPLIPWLLIFFFIWFFVFRQLRRSATQQKIPTPVYIVNPEALQS